MLTPRWKPFTKFGRLFLRRWYSLKPTIKDFFTEPPVAGETLTARGHIRSIRQFKKVGFIDISDGTTHKNLSVIFREPNKLFEKIHFRVGQSIEVKGKWVESRGSQSHELQLNPELKEHGIHVIGDIAEDYPLQKNALTLQYLRGLPSIRHRTSTLASVLRFRSYVENRLMQFFTSKDFIKVNPPIITSSDCEGAGEQFEVVAPLKEKSAEGDASHFFSSPVNLTVSTQLHLEILAQSLNRVWTLSPCFRAEKSHTSRHLSEFWMLEAEMCYVDRLDQLTDFTEAMIKTVVSELKKLELISHSEAGNAQDLIFSRFDNSTREILNGRWELLLSGDKWPSISYSEALRLINSDKNAIGDPDSLMWGDSLQLEHEKWLADVYFKSPVFITDYPLSQKPFYMSKSSEEIYDPSRPTAACFDLIFPKIGEVVGGSLREHDYLVLLQNVHENNIKRESLDWYLSTRLYGTVPHGGFGMGFERLLSYLCGLDNVKDIIPFFRVPDYCSC